MVNGISIAALSEAKSEAEMLPEEAVASYGVALDWQKGTRSQATALPMEVGPHRVSRDFSWTIDEPRPLLGANHGATPQEMLLSGVGGCLLVGYVVGASVMGVRLEKLNVEVRGEIDLRGFLGTEGAAPVAFKWIRYRVEIEGDGTREQFEELHRRVMERSPNRMTVASGVPVQGELTIAAHEEAIA